MMADEEIHYNKCEKMKCIHSTMFSVELLGWLSFLIKVQHLVKSNTGINKFHQYDLMSVWCLVEMN